MPRGTLFKDIELEAIRVGVNIGLNAPAIANYIGRNRVAVDRQIKTLRKAGTLDQLPLPFMFDRVADDMRRVERDRQKEMGKGKFR